MTSNHELVGRALGLLHQGLYPFVEKEMRSVYGDRWIEAATPSVPKDPNLKRPVAEILRQDVSAVLLVMWDQWNDVFRRTLSPDERALVRQLRTTRNNWAHNHTFSEKETFRALDRMEELLRAIDASEQADIILECIENPPPPPPPPSQMRTIAIHAAKGGVGKTTLVVNLAYELAKKGKRVLVVDLDDSANTSLLLGVNKADLIEQANDLEEIEQVLHSFGNRPELIDFLIESAGKDFKANKYIHSSSFKNYLNNQGTLDVIPSSYRTKVQELLISTHPRKRLEWGLKCLTGQYDFVIIDTPPTKDVISDNGLYAAQYLLIPSQMEYLSIYGIFEPLRRSKLIQEQTNQKGGNILGIVPMMTDAKLVLHKKIRKLVENTFPDIKVFSDVKRSTHVGMALSSRQPVSVYSKQHKEVPSDIGNMFSEITEELIQTIQLIESKKK
ncbi:Swt1 family HEPN domain-containing protein [Allocoleopsis franciscana]|uniref:ATPase involved in chromosome partitioning n=1 Tax=Allocoleopsis franciscana PCC 7113 TaxID=1173027 RepID=K9W830_9CYAN|nr:Swt1 family HEPN domain-containing protein [Allocoleopsis franciscana]AFZ16383.1 ATPase involved in chromosome partitioning [Allocoleopsis franciscana PCC 7113]